MTDEHILTHQELNAAVAGATQIGALRTSLTGPAAKPQVNILQRGPGEVGYDVDYDLEGNDW